MSQCLIVFDSGTPQLNVITNFSFMNQEALTAAWSEPFSEKSTHFTTISERNGWPAARIMSKLGTNPLINLAIEVCSGRLIFNAGMENFSANVSAFLSIDPWRVPSQLSCGQRRSCGDRLDFTRSSHDGWLYRSRWETHSVRRWSGWLDPATDGFPARLGARKSPSFAAASGGRDLANSHHRITGEQAAAHREWWHTAGLAARSELSHRSSAGAGAERCPKIGLRGDGNR